jgi:hypothetical protein
MLAFSQKGLPNSIALLKVDSRTAVLGGNETEKSRADPKCVYV